MKKIGIIGARDRYKDIDKDLLKREFYSIYELGDMIITGGCPAGAEQFAKEIAREGNIPIKVYQANWSGLLLRAGIISSLLIAKESDVLIVTISGNKIGLYETTLDFFKKMGKTSIYPC